MKIVLQSAEHIPPPYAYKLDIELEYFPNGLKSKVNWVFTDRESLSEQEIIDEGFEPNGDFLWSGNLSDLWANYLSSLPNQIHLSDTTLLEGDIQISIFKGNELYVPESPKLWILFAQELFQASLELVQIELPLHIFFQISMADIQHSCEVDVSFLKLQGRRRKQGNEAELALPWPNCQRLMSLLFEGEESGDPINKPSKLNAISFSIDRKNWMVYGKNYNHSENEWVSKVLAILDLK